MDKNIIFYFTGTGNSLKAAKDIGNVLGNCKIISIPVFKSKKLSNDYERIGFIFPVYAEGIPNCVKKFITEITFPSNKDIYYFVVVTHGGLKGNSISITNEELTKRGISLKAGFDIKMAANYVCLYNIPRNIENINKKSQMKINSVRNMIKNKIYTKIKKTNPLIFWPDKAAKSFSAMDRNYNISEKCNGCGICAKVCPVKNIEIEKNRPVFKHKCEQCMACINSCSNKAINYKNKTQKRRRYINPDITIEEIINGNNSE